MPDIIDPTFKKKKKRSDVIDPTFDPDDEVFFDDRKGKSDKKAKSRYNIYKTGGPKRTKK